MGHPDGGQVESSPGGGLRAAGRRSARLLMVGLVAAGAILVQAVVANGQEVPTREQPAGTLGMRVSGGKFSRVRFDAAERWLGRPIYWTTLFADRASPTAMVASVWGEMVNPAGSLPELARRLDVVMTVPLAFGTGSSRDEAGRAAIRAKLQETAAGAWDEQYRAVARNLAVGGYGDAVVRLGHEMTGPFYPWSSQGNADAYIAAFRHVHDVMAGVAPQLRFEWNAARNTFAEFGPPSYPGDAYVDVIGIDTYYNPLKGDPVPLSEDVWNRRYLKVLNAHLAFAKSHGKPVSYAEWATGGVDDPTYVQRMRGWFASLPNAGPGRLLYQSYWNVTKDHYDLAQLPRNAMAFRAAFGAARPSGPQSFFAVEDDGTDPAGTRPPPTWTSSPASTTVPPATTVPPVTTTIAGGAGPRILLDDEVSHSTERTVEVPLADPIEWTGPGSLRNASFRVGAEVTERRYDGPVDLQICFWQDDRTAQACARPVRLDGAVTQADLAPTSDWWTGDGWRWDRPAETIRVLFKDPETGTLLNEQRCGPVCFRGEDLPAGVLLSARVWVVATPPGD